MPLNTISSIFPDWIKDIVMIIIAMIVNAVVTLVKYNKDGFKGFTILAWLVNISLAMVMAFFIDSLILWVYPTIHIKAEMAMMVIVGIMSQDILKMSEEKGIEIIRNKLSSFGLGVENSKNRRRNDND